MIGVYDGREYHVFRSVGEFVQHILQRRYSGWKWFAHYGGRYDCNFIWDWLVERDRGIRWSFICSGSSVIRLRLQAGRNTVDLCDSYRLLPAGLRRLTETFQTKHRKWDAPDWESAEYNRDDCLALYEVLQRWFELVGEQAETVASTAMRYFRRHHLGRGIWRVPAEVEDAVREAYVGGRVEVFRRTLSPAKCYDVNSMYPWAMTGPVPVSYRGRVRRRVRRSGVWGVYDAEVGVPDMQYPPLPMRARKLVFPVGVWRGWFTSDELDRAEECGSIVRVIEGHEWDTDAVLASYVDDLWRRRQSASSDAERLVWKLLLNSLYGKFGQEPVRKVYQVDDGSEGLYPVYTSGGRPTGAAYRLVESRAGHLLPQIAAAVTARARVRLHELLVASSPAYCDTDSVMTHLDLPVSAELGGLKLEKAADEAEFCAPKLYRFGDRWTAKGLPDDDPELAGRYAGYGTVEYERNAGLVESLRCGRSCRRIRVVARRSPLDMPKRPWQGEDGTRPWVVRGGDLY